ncbi:MAG: 1-deoxy-D-xylulose-5-phosphate reductoisomerase, partial [Epsilonproteobacteria bacterium]
MILLGSTGSIGVNTLEIAKRFSLEIEVLVAGNNVALLNEQIKIHRPARVVIGAKEDVPNVNHPDVLFGEEGILEAIERASSNLLVNALVG